MPRRAAAASRCATRTSASGSRGPGRKSSRRCARSRSACRSSGSSAATHSPSSDRTGRGSIGRCAPARRSAPCRCRSMRTAVADEMAYVLAHAEATIAVVENQEQVDKVLSIIDRLPKLAPHGLRRAARPARLRPREALLDRRCAEGWAREAFRSGAARRLGGRGRKGQRLRPRGDPLHVGHHRAAERRDAHLRQHHHLGAQRQPVRRSRRKRRSHRLSAARLGRRSPVLLCAALRGGLLRQLPGSRRDRDRGPARDRHDLCLRAAARLREPAHAHHGADGGCGRAQAPHVPLFHQSRAQVGREDSRTRSRCRCPRG